LLSDLKKDISGWDTLKVKRYLTYYTAIPFESWVFDLSENEKNSIESGMPLYRITVKQQPREKIGLLFTPAHAGVACADGLFFRVVTSFFFPV
jgi:hypothetical protein